eukprot:m.507384 g.507384  ORF g.507384 m.507384 type:complete len:101 (+) comp21880_c0_seq2:383-685(+)
MTYVLLIGSAGMCGSITLFTPPTTKGGTDASWELAALPRLSYSDWRAQTTAQCTCYRLGATFHTYSTHVPTATQSCWDSAPLLILAHASRLNANLNILLC